MVEGGTNRGDRVGILIANYFVPLYDRDIE